MLLEGRQGSERLLDAANLGFLGGDRSPRSLELLAQRRLGSRRVRGRLGKAAQQLGKLFRESSEFGDLVLPVYFQVTQNRRGSDARQKLAALVANPGLPAVDALD
jgi:hypothetical protein